MSLFLSVFRFRAERRLSPSVLGIAYPVLYDPRSTLASRHSHEGFNPSNSRSLRAVRNRAFHEHVSDIFNRRIKITDAKV